MKFVFNIHPRTDKDGNLFYNVERANWGKEYPKFLAKLELDKLKMNLKTKEVKLMEDKENKRIPKQDGSGRGIGANAGRGGCPNPERDRKGINRRRF